MKKEIRDTVVNVGGFGVAAICALTGQCAIGVPIMAALTAYNGVDLVKDKMDRRKHSLIRQKQ